MKTLEDRAQAYADCVADNTSEVWNFIDEVYTELKTAYIVGAKEAISMQWRNPKDELPKDGENILIYYKYRESGRLEYIYSYMQVKFNIQNGFNLFENNMSKWGCKVLFWMPIPEPPKDGSE